MARPPKTKTARKDPGTAQTAAGTKSIRKDPPSRDPRGAVNLFDLSKSDPNRSYVWVNSASEDQSPAYYHELGYRVEKHGSDAAVPRGQAAGTPGEVVERLGQVLMSCTNDNRRELEAAGQAQEDAREQRYIVKRGARDPMRGLTGVRTGGEGGLESTGYSVEH